jgi:hypothetical protein
MRRHLVPAGLVVTAVLVSAAVATGGSSAGSDTTSATSRTVASTTTSDYRVVVAAERQGAGAAPAAKVRLESFRRTGGRWQRTGSHELAGPYFWKTLTAPRAVCHLEIRTAGPAARADAVARLGGGVRASTGG